MTQVPSNRQSLAGKAQSEVVAFLANPLSYAGSGVKRVDRVETHANLVFLAGSEAWKIKRAVHFAYMDFSTLQKRHAACVREVEINRRFGSELYLGSVPIVRLPGGRLAFGGEGEIVEWAVHMRRFDQSALLSVIAGRTGISHELARALAEVVHGAHQRAEPANPRAGITPLRELATEIPTALCKSQIDCPGAALLESGFSDALERSAVMLDERRANGFVRRCHGDLHLANIVLWQGRPALYDAIEFDEAIATIDTLYDLAFLLMDLDRHGERRTANAVLNHYLWLSGEPLDLSGLIALPLFLALRAAVRAMVTADRAGQASGEARERHIESACAYLRTGVGYLNEPPTRVVAIGGLSGTGKTTVAANLAPWLGPAPGAVHLRTDLERKRLAGVGELEPLPGSAYRPQARRRVYETLWEKAQLVVRAGQAVIVDAAFADPGERRNIEALARKAGSSFHGIWLHAEEETLLKRVIARRNDASDATPEVVRAQVKADHGGFTAGWTAVDAGGTLAETIARARLALKLESGRP